MAPPTKIVGPEQQHKLLEKARDCELMSLTQNECTLNGLDYICTPFKRLFQQCMVGKRQMRIEVTDEYTNA